MKAAPAPIVSGRYFLPKAPLLCLKRIPAWAVTSVNSIGPDGRGGVGLGDGDAAADCSAEEFAAGAWAACCLHPTSRNIATKRHKNHKDLLKIIYAFCASLWLAQLLQPDLDQHCRWTNQEQCVEWRVEQLIETAQHL